jgi:hypothetical protein
MAKIFSETTISDFTLRDIIAYMENTEESTWRVDTVRGKDGSNCFFGHLFNMGGGDSEKGGSRLWDYFEANYATTFMLYPVNDGQHPKYQQPTPKQRVIAYLKDLASGAEKTTAQLMMEEML